MYLRDNNEKITTSWALRIILAAAGLLVGFIAMRIFFVPFTIHDNTMLPTYKQGDTVLVLKHVSVKNGDVILVDSKLEDGKVYVRRAVALGGDTVELVNRTLMLNGKEAHLSWKTISSDGRLFPVVFSMRDTFPQLKLEADQLFLLGDNLDASFDSRDFGAVKKKNVIGRVIAVY